MLLVIVVMVGIWVREIKEKNKIEVIFCDVKQGDGIIIKEGSNQMLVDVGPKNKEMVRCLNKHLPFWDKKLEVVILTHEDSDHVGGLGEVERYYRIERLMGGVVESEQINYTDFLSAFDVIRMGKIEFEVLSPSTSSGQAPSTSSGQAPSTSSGQAPSTSSGQVPSTSSGQAGDKNSNSVVGELRVGGKRFLLMGDADAETEERLVWRNILAPAGDKLNYLKVSHHGSKDGTTNTLLEVIKPEVAIISVGKNWYGHPSEEVLERLSGVGAEIWRTDERGDIKIEVD